MIAIFISCSYCATFHYPYTSKKVSGYVRRIYMSLYKVMDVKHRHHRARIHSDTAAVHDAYWEDEVKTNASHEHFILKKQ